MFCRTAYEIGGRHRPTGFATRGAGSIRTALHSRKRAILELIVREVKGGGAAEVRTDLYGDVSVIDERDLQRVPVI